MARTWQLQEAKNKLSEVVDRAEREGPQTITRRGVPVAAVVSVRELAKRQRGSLVDFLRSSPLRDVELDLERPRDLGRDVRL
jgi:prevent-host-death family protein